MTTAVEAGLIRFIFPGRGGRVGVVVLPWVQDKSLHQYFSEPPLVEHRLLGRLKRRCCRNQHKVKQRLGFTPSRGDTFTVR